MTSRFGVFSKIVFVVLLMAVSTNGYAQSMTEGQIIQFVQQEQQKGSDQQTIVTKLLQKGVTVDQLRKIRKKYEAQKSQLGAVDLQESNPNGNNTAGRMRSKKEKALEKMNQQNGYMIRSQREELDEKRMSKADRQNELNEETRAAYTAFLDQQQKELGYALRELAERQRAVSDLETSIANYQTKLQTYNQEVAQKAAALANIEAELKARVASVKAEQKAAKSMQ